MNPWHPDLEFYRTAAIQLVEQLGRYPYALVDWQGPGEFNSFKIELWRLEAMELIALRGRMQVLLSEGSPQVVFEGRPHV